MPEKKQRLDRIVVEKGLARSRKQSQALIMAGKILVNKQPVEKPGALVSKNDEILSTGKGIPYVSRGGLKLEAALQAFDIDVNGWVCLDVGASTGGFTDCLLQNGASCVFTVDVGYGQLAWKLRQDPRVVVIERTNIRYMPFETLTEPIDLTTIDVSFISLKIVVPAVLKFMKDQASVLALIKPQFEVGKGKVSRGGLVHDPLLHNEVIADLKDFFTETGLICNNVIPSPLRGSKGNKEFIIWLKYSHQTK
jgi:23S rRNA (cytidine1920-2'-O)/16S rRNA (cytidine1409-2'-O)-methyltransferase